MSAYFNAPLRVPSGATLDVVGSVLLKGLTDVSGSLEVQSAANFVLYGVGANTTTLKTAADSASYTLTLPANVGSANQVLTTDGSTGELTWTTPSAPVGSVYSNAVAVSSDGDIIFATLAGAANVSVDSANSIVFNAGASNLTITQSNVHIFHTEESYGSNSGALIVDGGLGVAGNVYSGGNVGALIDLYVGSNGYIYGTADSADVTSGALTVAGGAGIAGNLYATTLNSVANVVVGAELFVTGNGIFDGRFIQSVDEITTESGNPVAATNIWTSGYKSVKHLAPTTLNDTYYEATGGDINSGQMLHLFYTPGLTNNSRVDFGSSGVYTGGGASQYLTFTNAGQSATMIYLQSTAGNGWRIINSGAQVS
jgi:hypothetical protein